MPKAKKVSQPSFRALKKAGAFLTLSCLIVASVSGPITRADSYDDQINTLKAQNAQNEAALGDLQGQAATYQDAIDAFQSQINTIQAQITDNESRQATLAQQIQEDQDKIAHEKQVLGEDLKTMYVDGQMTTIEELATSNNLSDYVDKQTYREAVQSKIQSTLKEIAALQAQLEAQKLEVEKLLTDEHSQKDQLAATQYQQAVLLAYNQAQQDAYTAQLRANNAQIASLRSQQAAAIARLTGSGGRSAVGSPIKYKNMTGPQSCGGGYRYCWTTYLDQPVSDPWGFGYARECVHYVLSSLANNGMYIPPFPPGGGNAYNWVPYTTSVGAAQLVSDPQPGDVVYMPIAPLGHVGMVDYVNDDGTVHVSQYNWYPGMYNTMDLYITSGVQFLRFHG